MRPLVLDSEALSLLTHPEPGSVNVMGALLVAARQGRGPIVPAVVLAEQYRNQSRIAAVNSMLSTRELVIEIRDTDKQFARLVGGVLAGAGADSTDMVDAHCVAVGVEHGGGTVLTTDVSDIERLAAPYGTINVSKV